MEPVRPQLFLSVLGLVLGMETRITGADLIAEEARFRQSIAEVLVGMERTETRPGVFPTGVPILVNCSTGDLERIGGCRDAPLLCSKRFQDMAEEGYHICPQPSLQRKGCVIYTCGVDEDPTFEVELARSSSCEVFAFDPSASARRWMGYLTATADPPLPHNLHFVPWGWWGDGELVLHVPPWGNELRGTCRNCFWPWSVKHWGVPSSNWTMFRLSSIAKRLGHSQVDLVKMDCEGVEYTGALLDDIVALKPKQIVLEQHSHRLVARGRRLASEPVRLDEWLALMLKLHASGYRQVAKGRVLDSVGEYTWALREMTT